MPSEIDADMRRLQTHGEKEGRKDRGWREEQKRNKITGYRHE